MARRTFIGLFDGATNQRGFVISLVALLCLAITSEKSLGQTRSTGTAFSVAPELVITNEHVVRECSSVEVISLDGRRVASMLATDAGVDLALLRVSGLT